MSILRVWDCDKWPSFQYSDSAPVVISRNLCWKQSRKFKIHGFQICPRNSENRLRGSSEWVLARCPLSVSCTQGRPDTDQIQDKTHSWWSYIKNSIYIPLSSGPTTPVHVMGGAQCPVSTDLSLVRTEEASGRPWPGPARVTSFSWAGPTCRCGHWHRHSHQSHWPDNSLDRITYIFSVLWFGYVMRCDVMNDKNVWPTITISNLNVYIWKRCDL